MDKYYVWSFVSLLLVIPLLLFTLPIQAFSEIENRSLQQPPKLTWESLISKDFMNQAETFVADHFPYRMKWVWAKSTLEQLRLNKEINGIVKGEDGFLFETFTKPDYTKLEQYTDAINQFAIKHPNVTMTLMLAPNSIGVYTDRLPWLLPTHSQQEVNSWVANKLSSSLTFLNGFDFLLPENDKLLYYRTDHHWSTYGAYLAYKAYATEANWIPLQLDDFTISNVSSSFLGSYHTRSLFSGLKPDNIDIFEPKKLLSTTVYIADTEETFTTMYDEQALAKKDQYQYFLGGVHALMTLTTKHEEATDRSKLLVIKDSYAHSMLPFLTSHVDEIHVIDLRYYNGSISDYIEMNEIEDVLLLYNTATIVNEHSLLKLKY